MTTGEPGGPAAEPASGGQETIATVAPPASPPDSAVATAPAAAAENPPEPEPGGAAGVLARLRGIPQPYWRALGWHVLPFVIVVAIGLVALKNHFSGVDWGDDFALYMRQAKGLAMGNIGEVISANRYAVDNSGWNTFSPYAYPWGWPVLITPIYALFGLNYEPVKLLEVIAFCVFLLCFYAIVRRRAGVLGATVLTLVIGVSRSFVGATDTVLSDIPFLCFIGVTLWWLDRSRERGILEERRHRLVVLGLLLAYTYNIRREGISLVVAVLALHLTVIAGRALRARTARVLRDIDWKTVALPYLTFAGAAAMFHLLLPTVLRPNAPGMGLSNIPSRFKYHQDVLAEHVGLKDPGQPIQLLGSETAGRYALTLLLVLAVVGLAARLLTRFEHDIHLAAYFCAASFVMLVSPYQENRYLFTITPLLLYFAYQALPAVAAYVTSSNLKLARLAAIPSALAVAGLILINGRDLKHSTEYHRVYDYTVNGPETVEATQMFTAVKTMTRGDDVILFFRARAMTLYTDRLAVQGSNLDQLLPRTDWYVMAKGSTYSQALLSDAEGAARGLAKAWENGSWVIWRVPPRAA